MAISRWLAPTTATRLNDLLPHTVHYGSFVQNSQTVQYLDGNNSYNLTVGGRSIAGASVYPGSPEGGDPL